MLASWQGDFTFDWLYIELLGEEERKRFDAELKAVYLFRLANCLVEPPNGFLLIGL